MEGLRHYALTIVSAALICGILSGLIGNGAGKKAVQLLLGLFLTIAAVKPMTHWNVNTLDDLSDVLSLDASDAVAEGERISAQARREIIKSQSESYILNKAAELDLHLNVDISLDEDNIPVFVELEGEVSPYLRQHISQILENDLGITKENQQWSG